jgi:membrane protein DedA with SNARE-associated domain
VIHRAVTARPRASAAAALVTLAVAVLAVAVLNEGLADATDDARRVALWLVRRFGPGASFGALYLEESGVPLPVFGDVLVVYLGHHFARWPVALVAVWLGLVATTVGGSTNLYLIARWWGRPLIEGPLGLVLHVTPERVARAERWFERWGVPAIIFGRHILGFRIPVTVAAGLFSVPYHRVFAPSVAVSTGLWGAFWLALGVIYGRRLGSFLDHHGWMYVAVPLAGVLLFLAATTYAWYERRQRRV